jgi:NRPS condensation-like uncharacterized protein
MENKQTAVEWLEQQMNTSEWMSITRFEIIQQAKQMEKEQIEKAFYDSMVDIVLGKMSSTKEYYNETYANDTTTGLPEEDSNRRAWHY